MKYLPSFIDEVCTKLDFEQLFVPFGLETSERKPVKCLSPRREANKIIHSFVSSRFDFLFGLVINILLTELSRSVLTTSVKILPYSPLARLIRAKYKEPLDQSDCWKLFVQL